MGYRMKSFSWLRSMMVALACIGFVVPPACGQTLVASATQATFKPPLVLDVELDEANVLHGEVRDAQGQVQANTDVVLWQGKKLISRTRTDDNGRFRLMVPRGGRYLLATPDISIECRAWIAGLAPPDARQSLLVTSNTYSVRGQQPINEVFCFNPFLMGTIIAAAIAIPIAVHDSGNGQLPDGS